MANETLDDLLGMISVAQVDEYMVEFNKEAPRNKDISCLLGWYLVEDESDNRGYFPRQEDAFGYRLFLINVRLNYPKGGTV